MKKSYGVWVAVFLAISIFAWVMAGGIGMYFDLASLAVVVIIPMTMLFASFSLRELGAAFAAAFGADTEPAVLRRSMVVFRTMERLVLVSGLFGVVSGLIAIFSNVSSAEQIGKGLAIALLTPLYAMMLMMALTLPLRAAVGKRLAATDQRVPV
ncbi:MotA/TolQ/ExbB proton channel family protein [Salinispira pacifica]